MCRKLFSALLFLMIPFSVFPLKWHDEMVRYLLTNDNVDKNMVVERNEHTNKIYKASYKFVINRNNKDILDFIKYNLLDHANEATKFSLDNDKILLQVSERPNIIYNYRFDHDPKDKSQFVLLISVE